MKKAFIKITFREIKLLGIKSLFKNEKRNKDIKA